MIGYCLAIYGDATDIKSLGIQADSVGSFLNFDVQKQKVQTKVMKVLAVESVTVPSGTFQAYKVEVVSADDEADKQTIWIGKDTHQVLKITQNLPSMGGAVLTSELLQ